jgi:hypothetical protein
MAVGLAFALGRYQGTARVPRAGDSAGLGIGIRTYGRCADVPAARQERDAPGRAFVLAPCPNRGAIFGLLTVMISAHPRFITWFLSLPPATMLFVVVEELIRCRCSETTPICTGGPDHRLPVMMVLDICSAERPPVHGPPTEPHIPKR